MVAKTNITDENPVTTIKPITPTNKSIWERIIEAPASVVNEEDRHRNRLMSSILLVMIIVGGLAILIISLIQVSPGIDADILATMAVIGITAILYNFNRQGHTEWAARGFVLITFMLFTFIPFIEGSNDTFMFGSVIPIFIAGMYFRARISLYISIAIATIQLSLIPFTGDDARGYMYTWVALLVIYALIRTFIQHQHVVEKLRREQLLVVNEKLRESEASLEHRVQTRTRDLEIVSDMSKQVAGMLELDTMLNYTVEHVATTFDWYSVSILLFDEANHDLRYHAGVIDGAQFNMDDLRRLPMSAPSIATHAANSKEAVVVNNVHESMLFKHHEVFPRTQSELAVPMLVRGELIGVLDVQSTIFDEFDANSIKTMTSLAEQLAIAVQTARLYGQQVATADKLREVDNIKSQFLASMSHELRTPLNAILNFTEFVSLGMFGPVNDAQKDALSKSLDSGRHLLSLINDVLDITKIESGNMALFIEADVDIDAEIQQVCATAETLLERKRDHVALVLDIDEKLPMMVGDRRRIRQILLNVISNAIKFTEEGSVTFSVKKRADHLLFAVIDTGPGIPLEQHESIFEPFIQTETGIKHEGGTGLGLPITKRLIEAHEGTLTLESNVGEGLAFYITLPIASDALRQEMQQVATT